MLIPLIACVCSGNWEIISPGCPFPAGVPYSVVLQSTKLLQCVISGDVRGLSDFKYVLLCWAFCAAVEGYAIYDPKGFWNSVEQKELLLHQFHVTVSSFCICIFDFCSSGSGWKKNMGKTLLRICKKPKIFWANTKSRQSCIRLLEEGSGITTSHLCHHSHTATTQQRPNYKRSISFFLSTFAKHLAMFSIPCSRLSAVNHANCWFIESFLMTLCVCVWVCFTQFCNSGRIKLCLCPETGSDYCGWGSLSASHSYIPFCPHCLAFAVRLAQLLL